ncbi:MAG: 3-hydroxyacyl-CoA dehydrogenase, partial [Mesorhizobium sp.]
VRLPCLVGPLKALSMIVSGTPIGAAEALAAGLIDAVFDGALTAQAVRFASEMAGKGGPFTPVRERDGRLDRAELPAFDRQAAELAQKARGLEAPIACTQSVRNAIALPFE